MEGQTSPQISVLLSLKDLLPETRLLKSVHNQSSVLVFRVNFAIIFSCFFSGDFQTNLNWHQLKGTEKFLKQKSMQNTFLIMNRRLVDKMLDAIGWQATSYHRTNHFYDVRIKWTNHCLEYCSGKFPFQLDFSHN